MTNEQINIAIAKACGWKYEKNETHAPDGSFWWSKEPEFPNYCNDLNAMHEAEKLHADDDKWTERYWLALYEATQETRWPYDASAAQRAEAFLKTIGKWEGAPQ
jgi:hypothetical protein